MKQPFDLSLYLVTDKPENYRKPLLAAVEEAVSAGATIVQYRADGGTKRELHTTALELQKLLRPRKIPLIINDHIDLALAIDADGAHIGQNDLPVAIARRLLGPDRILGVSISTETDLANTDLTVVDYLGIGPVYSTISKRNAPAAIGTDGLARLKTQTHLPIVAIGGISIERAPAVLATGVNGIAVVSALSQIDDIPAAARALLSAKKT